MRLSRNASGVALAVLIVSSVFAAFAHEEQELVVGASAAGKLKLVPGFPQPFEVPPSIFPGISGFASGEIAFHSTILDDPTNDVFQLSTAGDFRWVLLAKDAGIEVLNDAGSGFMNVGETFIIGPSPFDTHPVWNIVSNGVGKVYSLTLELLDVNSVYTNSGPIVLSFISAPAEGPFEIHFKAADPQRALLSWSSTAVGWVAECANALTDPNWNTITNEPAMSGTNFSLSIDTTGPQQFFRLRRN